MKKLIILLVSVFALFLISCKKKGVCTCKDGSVTTKIYYEEMTPSDKRALKRACNDDSDAKVVKTEYTDGNSTTTVEQEEEVSDFDNCEWSRTGKD